MSQFSKGLKSASHTLDSFKSTVMGIGASLGVAFGVKGIVDWVHGAANAVTENRALAERVGMTSEAFGKLGYAAKLSGVGGEELTHSLEKMNEKLGEAAITGEGPAADALRRFGLSARQLTQMGTEQAFLKLSDVLGSIRNPAERAAFAIATFGKSGSAMINMASQGSAALKAMGDEGMATGAVLNSIESEKIKEANVAMMRMEDSIQGVATQIAVNLAPFIEAIADQFLTWMKTGTKAGSYMAQAIDWVTAALGGVADVVQVLQTGWHYFMAGFAEVVSFMLEGVDAIIQAFGWLWEKITGVKLEVTSLAKDLSDAFEKASIGELNAAETAWNKKWGHERVREFVDDLKTAADQRATFNAGKAKEFTGVGTHMEHPKIVETHFGGAFEMGSKEAYSAAIKSRSMQLNGMNNRIEINTRATAEATGRVATGIARLVDVTCGKGKLNGVGGALGESMTAGN